MNLSPVDIGKGFLRLTIISANKRNKLIGLDGVEIYDDRVIFPSDMFKKIIETLFPPKKHRKKRGQKEKGSIR